MSEEKKILTSDEEIYSTLIEDLAAVTKKGFDEIKERTTDEVEAQLTRQFYDLRAEIEEIKAIGVKYDNSYLAAYQENLDNTHEKFRALQESYKGVNKTSISESAFVYSGSPYTATIIDSEHELYVSACRDKVKYSPYIRNIRNLVRYATLSGNIRIDIPDEKIDEMITKVFEDNNFNRRLEGWIENCYVDGEVFPLIFFDSNGGVKIRQIDPIEIKEVVCSDEDVETLERVNRMTPAGKEYTYKFSNSDGIKKLGKKKDDKTVMWFHYGNRTGHRGELPLLPLLRYDRIYEEISLDLARLYHERAKVVWIKQYIGPSKSSDSSRTALQPRGGSIKIETDRVKWRIEKTELQDTNAKTYGSIHRSAIAASVSLPSHLIFMDSSAGSYSSLRKADTAYTLVVKATQKFWSDNIKEMVKVILQEWVDRGILPEKTTIERLPSQTASMLVAEVTTADKIQNLEEKKAAFSEIAILREKEEVAGVKKEKIELNTVDLPVSIIFPRHESENILLTAQAINVLIQSGVFSRRTGMKMLGLDPDLEMALVAYEYGLGSVNPMGGKTEPIEKNTDRKIDRDQVQKEGII